MDVRLEDLASVDAAVRRAVLATDAWQVALRATPLADGVTGQAPLGRHRAVAGKTAYDALGERVIVSQEEPLRTALRRWVGALTVERVTEDERAEEADEETARTALVRLDVVTKTSFREAWRRLVAATNAAEGRVWIDALAERGSAVAAVRRERAIRAEEAALRLGADSRAALVAGAAPGPLAGFATTFLAETRDLSRSLTLAAERRGHVDAGTFAGQVTTAVAREAPAGWPARLTLRSLVATFGTTEDLGRGLRVEATLPEAIGAASFARGLAAFGFAYRRAAALTSTLPFAIAIDPDFVDAHRFGFAFGALATLPEYHRRGLDLGPGQAREQARTLSATALLEARKVALAALLAEKAARPDAASFREWTHDVYGEGVPASLMGAFPRTDDAAPRLVALLTTAGFSRELRDHFEEDWFRNPRAWRFLRARASGPARPEGEEATPDPKGLARAFEEALG